MNRQDLAAAITAAGKDQYFWIRDEPLPDELPDFTTIMEPEADGSGWTVFTAERARRINPTHFDTEAEACDYVFGLLGGG